jgi:hypothetical protein
VNGNDERHEGLEVPFPNRPRDHSLHYIKDGGITTIDVKDEGYAEPKEKLSYQIRSHFNGEPEWQVANCEFETDPLVL